MNNILRISAIAILAFVANNAQAAELVQVQKINASELLKVTKLNLAQSIKFNTIAFSPIEKTARAQVAMNDIHFSKKSGNMNINKTVVLAE
ncbi:MAG: hypothetical protein WBC60_18330 [Cognaticolwellia sp.]|jgi:hypothetical protein